MKVLVVSDTHGRHENLKYVIKKVSPIDLMIHLGDSEGYEGEIAEMAGCPLEIVAGNNDFFSGLEQEKLLRIGRHKVLLTHGHYYYVTWGLDDLRKAAAKQGADIVMFGHIHRPMIDYGKITVINPGSISLPRQEGHLPSYIIMDVDRKGDAHFAIKYLKK